MRCVPDASAKSLMAFVEDSIDRGIAGYNNGWPAYDFCLSKGFHHRGRTSPPARKSHFADGAACTSVSSVLKRWQMGPTQAFRREHLNFCLYEFTWFISNLQEPRQVVLPARSAGGGRGPCALQADGQVSRYFGERSKPLQVMVT